MSTLGIGLIYLVLSAIQQFLVNKLLITSLITIVVSIGLAYYLRNEKRKMSIVSVVGACNILGLFIHRYTMLEILGLISFVTGLVFVMIDLIKMFKGNKKIFKKILVCIGCVLVIVMSGFLNFTAVFPAKTMVMMGKSGTPNRYVFEAAQNETMLANGVKLVSDIQYDTQVANGFLDIYYTTKEGESHPTLIFIHGGGYLWGDKASGDPNAKNSSFDISTGGRFLEQGYNVVQMNYAFAPEYEFPIAVKQLNRGIKYLVENADQLGLDMTRVVIGGGSAGGNLAGTLVNIQTNSEYANLVDETPSINKKYIKACVFEGGLFDNSRFGKTGSAVVDWSFLMLGRAYLRINELATNMDVVKPTNVLDYVTVDFPASFISDGNAGTFTDQAEDLHEILDGFEIDNELNLFSKEDATLAHGFEESGCEQADITFMRMFEFLKKQMGR